MTIYKGSTVLVQDLSGKWSLPGGRIDPGETPWKAAAREREEETGSKPPCMTNLRSYDYHDHTRIYIGHSKKWGTSKFKKNSEIQSIKIVKLTDIFNYPLRDCAYKSFKWLQGEGAF